MPGLTKSNIQFIWEDDAEGDASTALHNLADKLAMFGLSHYVIAIDFTVDEHGTAIVGAFVETEKPVGQ